MSLTFLRFLNDEVRTIIDECETGDVTAEVVSRHGERYLRVQFAATFNYPLGAIEIKLSEIRTYQTPIEFVQFVARKFGLTLYE